MFYHDCEKSQNIFWPEWFGRKLRVEVARACLKTVAAAQIIAWRVFGKPVVLEKPAARKADQCL
jgi:hypothetical protein